MFDGAANGKKEKASITFLVHVSEQLGALNFYQLHISYLHVGQNMHPVIVKAKNLKEILTPERCYIYENCGVSTGEKQVSIARARVVPGVATKAHHLEGVQEIYVITEGKGRVQVGKMEPAEVCKGDVVTIPAGTIQKIINNGKSDLVFYCICTPAFTQECYCEDEK